MKGISKFITVLAVLILIALGVVLWGQALGKLDIKEYLVGQGLIMRLVGSGLLLIALIVIWMGLREMRAEPTIAFRNPQGEVRVAFSAIEEFIRRLGNQLDDVRELRPRIIGSKKGLEIHARVTLKANVHIPQATAGIQDMIRRNVQGVLGIEAITAIKIYIAKIMPEEIRRRERSEKGGEGE